MRVPLAALAGVLGVFFVAGGAHALTYTVTNTANSGAGSLRQAVLDANANPGADIIAFGPAVTGKITLASQIAITEAVTINGPGAKVLTVSGNNVTRVINIDDGNLVADSPVTISGLTLADGYTGTCVPVQNLSSGGAIASKESLTLTNVVIRDSFASSNGGGLSFGPTQANQALTITGGDIYNNRAGCSNATTGASGGALNVAVDGSAAPTVSATVLIQGTHVTNNSAVRHAGGLRLFTPGSITLKNVTLTGNSATNLGGGVFVTYGSGIPMPSVTVDSSLIAANYAGNSSLGGGGLSAFNDRTDAQTTGTRMTVVVRNSTVSGNAARNGPAGGISIYGNVDMTIQNSTIASNVSAQQDTAPPSKAGGVFREIGVQSGLVTPNLEGLLTIQSSILSGNVGTIGPEDLGQQPGETFANAIAMSNSLVGSSGTITPTPVGAGNLSGDALLLPLGNYGGPTLTHALATGSPAIDTGANPAALTFDQRTLPRTLGAATDMGAFESGSSIALGCADVDGNGVVDGLTDGLMALRAMLGLTGTSVTNGAVGANATRPTWTQIRAYMNANCGTNFSP